MKKLLLAAAVALSISAGGAFAQSSHWNTQNCYIDIHVYINGEKAVVRWPCKEFDRVTHTQMIRCKTAVAAALRWLEAGWYQKDRVLKNRDAARVRKACNIE